MIYGSTSFIVKANDFVLTIFFLLLLPDNPTSFKNEDSWGGISCPNHFRPFPTMSRNFLLQTRTIHTQADHMTWTQGHATHDR